ncbi:hypothetical protein CFC21_106237 [Triticum aestivum]|uniref:MSP domain-containing protein n=2 Tax=Triticum aestivum TaxID=4565 RepID=A0A9R1MED8_WHEAT|nr:hypothetical protein CFC21_106237 [Triticum aestivum]
MKLWDRECMQTFEFKDQFITEIYHATFNPNDTFATVSFYNEKYTLKVWSLDLGYNYPLHGHSSKVNCLDFFTCHDQEFLVTGSDDWTAKIWYLPQKICVYTLEAFVSPDLFMPSHTYKNHQDWLCWRCLPSCMCDEKDIAGCINPRELRFPYNPNDPISCSLYLTNNTNENVAFRLVDKSRKSPWCFTKLPLYGIVPPRSTYTLIVTTKEEMRLKENKDFDLVIQSSLLGGKYIMVFQNQSESDHFFEEAKEFGNMVHEVILEAVYQQYKEIKSEVQNISVKYNPDDMRSIDAHPTQPWVLTGHRNGYACVWNHEMKYPTNSFKVAEVAVNNVKFIARREWIIAQTHKDVLHLYDCACVKKIKKIKSVESSVRPSNRPILAVHPTLPCVLSSYGCLLLVLDWDQTWKPTYYGTWDGNLSPRRRTVAFNPWDQNCFASGSCYGEIEVWRLDSNTPEYSLPGHYDMVNCLDFIRRGDQHYLVSGHQDCTAKIWDLQKRECICTLQAMSPVLCALAHPTLPVLITGTQHGIIQIWSSADFRLKRTINLGGGGGPVVGLACLMGSQRIVIGQENAISIMDYFRSRGRRRARALAKQAETELTQAEEEDGETEVLTRAKAEEAGAKQRWAEHSETEEQAATQEQRSLQPGSAAEAECSQAKGEHREREEPAVLPPKSGYAMSRVEHRRREKRRASRARAPARRAEAEGSTTEAEPVFWLSVCEFSRDGRNSAILKIS